jgi:hypothetical protein
MAPTCTIRGLSLFSSSSALAVPALTGGLLVHASRIHQQNYYRAVTWLRVSTYFSVIKLGSVVCLEHGHAADTERRR